MDSRILKHRRLEKYLNTIEFRDIRIGSLLAQTFELNYYNPCSKSIKNFIRIFKYLFYLFFPKDSLPVHSDFIFTKLISRLHFNELMDPLIIHFLENSAILCSENSFDNKLIERYPINEHMIRFSQTINNKRGDISNILFVFFKSTWSLFKNRRRLQLSKEELIFFLAQLIVQLRSVSFWDYYFSRSTTKPKCIVTEFDRNSVSSALILSAKKYNIISITLTHGVICDYGFTPLLADYIFCWGELQQNQLKEQGVPPQKIIVTGNPMVKTFDQKEVSQSEKVVCFAISPEILNRLMIELFISAVERIGAIKGMIKLHPSLQKKNYLWINNLSSKIIVKDYTEITNKELFEKIDLLIVHQSGIANEALASGIPVVVLEPDGEGNFSELQKELINSAGCRAAVNQNQLIAILNDFISDPKSFGEWSKERSKKYLEYLFEKTGEDSIQAMITGINRLTA